MTLKNTKAILFASLIAAMILPFSGMANAESSTYDSTYSDNPSKFILTEVTFPKGQEQLAKEITNLLEFGENNPEMRSIVDSSMNNLKPLMIEYRLSLISENGNSIDDIYDNIYVQPDYHKPNHNSLYDFQVTAWVEYPCQGQWLICKSSTNNNNIDRGTTFSTTVPIEKNPTGRDLQFHHKIKNTSGYSQSVNVLHFGSFMDMDEQRSVGCKVLNQTLNYRNNQSHDVRYCVLQGIEEGDRAQLSMIIR